LFLATLSRACTLTLLDCQTLSIEVPEILAQRAICGGVPSTPPGEVNAFPDAFNPVRIGGSDQRCTAKRSEVAVAWKFGAWWQAPMPSVAVTAAFYDVDRRQPLDNHGPEKTGREKANWSERPSNLGSSGTSFAREWSRKMGLFRDPFGCGEKVRRLNGGQGGIRTRGGCYTTHAFQACALNHSATCPERVRSHL
jgi:hypothetical protein